MLLTLDPVPRGRSIGDDLRVTRVRKEISRDGTHEHIEGICTDAGTHYTRREVVDSINAGITWKTSADGYEAIIEPVSHCARSGCLATPSFERIPTARRRTISRTSTAAERSRRQPSFGELDCGGTRRRSWRRSKSHRTRTHNIPAQAAF
jgi:hypothetical protein